MARKSNGHANGNGHADPADFEALVEAPPPRRRPRPIELPDGRTLQPAELGPELLPGVWACPERKYLIRRAKEGFTVNPWGYPIPIRYECAEAADEDMAETASRITAIWSTDPELGQHTFTMREVNSGTFLARFDSPPFTIRRDVAWIADVLKAQLRSIPRRRVAVFPGWSISPAGARRFVEADGERATYHADLTYDGARQIEPPSLEDAAYLARALVDWCPDGRGVACLGLAVRGAFATLKSVGTSLVLTGPTGSGKTTAARFALGLFGAVPATCPPTANFEASAAALKATIGRRYDHPTVLDDFHRSAQAGAGAKTADNLDALFRAAADGVAWSSRGMRDGRLREPVFLRAGYILTGEELPGLLASAERRFAWISFEDVACDNDGLYGQWDTLQAIWERIGHAVIRWAMPIFAGPDPQALTRLIAQRDAAWEAAIFAALREARPDAPTKFARSLAGNWAAIMAGADIADEALGGAERDGPMVETLRPRLLAFALAQLDRLAAGGAAGAIFDPEFIAAARAGDFLFDGETHQPFRSFNLADAPTMKPLGYDWNPAKDCWLPGGRGDFAGWRRRDLGEDWLLPGPLLAAARRRARALGLDFPFSEQTFPAHLTAIGYALAGDDGRHTVKVRLGEDGRRRVLRVPIPADEPDEAPIVIPPALIVIPYAARGGPAIPAPQQRGHLAGPPKSEPDQAVKEGGPAGPAGPAVSRAQDRGGNADAPAPQSEIDAKAQNLAAQADRGGSATIVPAKASNGPGERPGAVAGRSRPQKPVATLDCGHVVIGGEASALPPALSPKKVKRLGLGPVVEWAASRQIGRVMIAQAWAEAADVQPNGRSQRVVPAAGGAAIELYFPDGPLGEAPAQTAGEGLAHYQRITGKAPRVGFTYRGGVQSFWTILEALDHDSRRELLGGQTLAPAAFPAPAHAIPEPAADLGWMRLPTEAELGANSCVVIDANSQYLRAMGGHMFGIGDPQHFKAPAFDAKRPGYWRATWRAPDWPATLPPPGYPLAEGESGWMMTETLALLTEIGAAIDIKEAWLWEGASALAKVQTRLRDALYGAKAIEGPAGELALDMVKRTYKEGVGSMSRREARTQTTPDPRHRPHWRHAIIARSTALILRDLHACGAHPVAIAVDGFAFLTELAPDEFMASVKLKSGLHLGEYKVRPGPAAGAMLEALGAWEAAGAPARNHKTRADVIGLITGKGE